MKIRVDSCPLVVQILVWFRLVLVSILPLKSCAKLAGYF